MCCMIGRRTRGRERRRGDRGSREGWEKEEESRTEREHEKEDQMQQMMLPADPIRVITAHALSIAISVSIYCPTIHIHTFIHQRPTPASGNLTLRSRLHCRYVSL